jgi:F420-0:gamma-glutamyl ligase
VVNAGVDDSNANGKTILLPHDSFAAADAIRTVLKKRYRLKRLGVLITDSRISPLRAGVTGVALGYAGFKGVRDYRGTQDLFGRTLRVTQTNVADCLATAAVLLMGEGSERSPLSIIENAPAVFSERVSRNELHVPLKDDVFRGLFRR